MFIRFDRIHERDRQTGIYDGIGRAYAKSRFSTNISLYLENDTKEGYFTKERQTLMNSNPEFKIIPLFNSEYLRNGTI